MERNKIEKYLKYFHKQGIPEKKINEFMNLVQLQLIKEIEQKATEFIFQSIETYGADIFEGNSDAFDDLRLWLSEKKVEIKG